MSGPGSTVLSQFHIKPHLFTEANAVYIVHHQPTITQPGDKTLIPTVFKSTLPSDIPRAFLSGASDAIVLIGLQDMISWQSLGFHKYTRKN